MSWEESLLSAQSPERKVELQLPGTDTSRWANAGGGRRLSPAIAMVTVTLYLVSTLQVVVLYIGYLLSV